MRACIYGGNLARSHSSSPTTAASATEGELWTYLHFGFGKLKKPEDFEKTPRTLSISGFLRPVDLKNASINMVCQKMSTSLSLAASLILLLTLEPLFVRCEPDPMMRPTRPKVFTSADELRRYLDLVRDYYSLSGKARYGKRAQILPFNDYPWEVVQIPSAQTDLLTLRQHEQLFENPLKQELQRDIHNQHQQQQQQQQDDRQFHLSGQEPYFHDVMAKYYHDLQY